MTVDASKARKTDARVLIDLIQAVTVIDARSAGTLVNIYFTIHSSETGHTYTGVTVNAVITGALVQARIAGTVVPVA